MQLTMEYLAGLPKQDVLHLVMLKINPKAKVFKYVWQSLEKHFINQDEIEHFIPAAIVKGDLFFMVYKLTDWVGEVFVLLESPIIELTNHQYIELRQFEKVGILGKDDPCIQIGLLNYVNT